MKQKLIQILSFLFRSIDRGLCRLHLKRPKVIIFMDGGICSQMLMYLHGQYYVEQGLDVCYDTRWFDVCGKDQFGEHPRIFEFTEMWPTLPFRQIRGWRLWIYRHLFKTGELMNDVLPNPHSITRSVYLYGYWDLPKGEYERLFAKCYDLNKATIPAIASAMDFNNAVGVHVRRGDLAKGDNPIYGGVSDSYFLRAIEFCNKQFSPNNYLFFSDDPNWVEQNICLPMKQSYVLLQGNKAWEDLWLLAHCSVIVASQGSFGKVAAQLNIGASLIQYDNEYAIRGRDKSFFIY